MAIEVEDIVSYWRSSELNEIADYDSDGSYDSLVIEGAIADAYAELEVLSKLLPEITIDVYAKRLTICTLLSRLNINPNAVELPLNDCLSVRETIEKFIQKTLNIATDSKETNIQQTKTSVTLGNTSLVDEMENF